MNKKDILQRFLFENAAVRGDLVHLEKSYQTIIQQHGYPSAIQQLLGEMLVAATLLTASIKFEGKVTVQFQGKAKLKLLLIQCTHQFNLRGVAQWQGEGNFDPVSLLNELKLGMLVITMEPENNPSQRYQGIVSWEGESIASSIEGYFKNSEQLPTRLWIAVTKDKAAGFLVQTMPSETEKNIPNAVSWEHITHLADTITPQELLTLDNETLLRRLFVEEVVRLFDAVSVQFKCTCNAQRCENAITLLGQEDAEQILAEKQVITVTCEFCNKEYIFDRIDIARIFNPGNKPASSSEIH